MYATVPDLRNIESLSVPVQARLYPVVKTGIVEVQRREKAQWGRVIRAKFREEMRIE